MLNLQEPCRVVIKESEIVDNADEICKDRYVKWIEGELSEGGSNAEITVGKNFKSHFLDHKGLLEGITGKKYPKYKANGQEFLDDMGKVISDGTVKYEGKGTIKKRICTR